jgi:hypothetical protein
MASSCAESLFTVVVCGRMPLVDNVAVAAGGHSRTMGSIVLPMGAYQRRRRTEKLRPPDFVKKSTISTLRR